MRQSSKSTITFTDKGNIREITGSNYEVFKQYSIGKKLRFVRETLEEMHSKKEFSRGKVAKAAGMSYQGLKNIEEEHNKRPYNGTIKLLCKVYDLPLKLFTDEEYCNSLEGFLLGKQSNKEKFFENYYKMNFNRHPLDPSYCVHIDEGEYFDIDPEAYDVIHNDDGSISFDRYTVEISLKMYQTSSRSLVSDSRIIEETVLTSDDVEHLKELIQREVTYMKSKLKKSLENQSHDTTKLIQEHIKRLDKAIVEEE
ncbi:transcriptional regulator with XRE-family HTH domain [Paenibacillus sp. LBL]|uniref:hypothetical protein n=1 Tax=Paenibacillus sp. LBL TaxID=2940563 RepID=UPI0024762A88|nr:hypothetical protein [Paenibacillus sp. LBL]MDH6670129.1 transcriptional regulator with XRE-family HTH domain [Paenibacillus sp. LBL]